ncbi:MAG: hypothetical protein H6600_06955 [Flavobacteriales bacterium]|nr:hypothetical protein [Flavobacteriales bacterium]
MKNTFTAIVLSLQLISCNYSESKASGDANHDNLKSQEVESFESASSMHFSDQSINEVKITEE